MLFLKLLFVTDTQHSHLSRYKLNNNTKVQSSATLLLTVLALEYPNFSSFIWTRWWYYIAITALLNHQQPLVIICCLKVPLILPICRFNWRGSGKHLPVFVCMHVFIKLPDGRSIRKSLATGQQSTNYRAEAYVLLAAAQTMNQKERLPTQCFWLTACPPCRVFNHEEGTRSLAASDRICSCLRTEHMWPSSGSLLTVVLEAMRKQTGCQNGKQVGAICTPHVLQCSKDHPQKRTSERSGDSA